MATRWDNYLAVSAIFLAGKPRRPLKSYHFDPKYPPTFVFLSVTNTSYTEERVCT